MSSAPPSSLADSVAALGSSTVASAASVDEGGCTIGLLRPVPPSFESAGGCCGCLSIATRPAPPLPQSAFVDTRTRRAMRFSLFFLLVISNEFYLN
jgi:hypothetical protein